MDQAALNMLGIAKKAGKVVIGEEPVATAARNHGARLILIASDAAPNTARQAKNLPGNAQAITCPMTKAELGGIFGRASCAVVAITDARLALAVVEKIAEGSEVDYEDLLTSLRARVLRVDKRQEEKKAHLKNKKAGKIRIASKVKASGKTKPTGKTKQ